MRLVDALIKANKDFELLVVPNANHGMGGAYGQRRLNDFFVFNLLGPQAPVAGPTAAHEQAAAHSTARPVLAAAHDPAPAAHAAQAGSVDLGELVNEGSELRGMIERYSVDRITFQSSAPPSASPCAISRLRDFTRQWQDKLEKLEFDHLCPGWQGRLPPLQELPDPPASPDRPAVEGADARVAPRAVRPDDRRSRAGAARGEVDGLVEGGRFTRQADEGDRRRPARARARVPLERQGQERSRQPRTGVDRRPEGHAAKLVWVL